MDRPMRAKSQTTCYVIAYDIPDDRRRTKVHDLLLGYGAWTQYSLFECFLTDKDVLRLRSKLAKLVAPKEDSVRWYPLCASCLSKVTTIGGPRPTEDIVYVV